MSYRKSWLQRKTKSALIVLTSIVAIYLVHKSFVAKDHDDISHINSQSVQQEVTESPFRVSPIAAELEDVISSTRPALSAEIESLGSKGEFQRAKRKLLDRALAAVESADNNLLAVNLAELGELAMLQSDLGMAEVYLSEALELYDELGDELQVAGVHVQMGRLHLHARQKARRASDAYDQLLLSRWKISQGGFSETQDQLNQIVETNLSLDRYGAAASALNTLYQGYSAENNIVEAHRVGIEAIKLNASSGKLHAANAMLDTLKSNGLSMQDAERVKKELQHSYAEYEASVHAIGAARDYAQLYNHLLSQGDALQAWRFRRQAEQSLSKASQRAQYRRQPDVLVQLYRSNKNMDSALTSLQKANAVYSRHGSAEGIQRSQQLRALIY